MRQHPAFLFISSHCIPQNQIYWYNNALCNPAHQCVYKIFDFLKLANLFCTFINRNKLVICQNGEFVRLCNENGYKKIFFLFRFRFGFVINVVLVFLICCFFLLCFWLCVAFYCSNSNDINDLNLLWFYAQTQTDPN